MGNKNMWIFIRNAVLAIIKPQNTIDPLWNKLSDHIFYKIWEYTFKIKLVVMQLNNL